MFEDFFSKKVDYFWEYDYAFGEVFLKGLFGENYIHKYSLVGEGIYHLVKSEGKLYDVRFKEVKKMVVDDGRKAYEDATKDLIVSAIRSAITDRPVATEQGKFITFPLDRYIARIEVVKKKSMPD